MRATWIILALLCFVVAAAVALAVIYNNAETEGAAWPMWPAWVLLCAGIGCVVAAVWG